MDWEYVAVSVVVCLLFIGGVFSLFPGVYLQFQGDRYVDVKNTSFDDGIISFQYPETWKLSEKTTKTLTSQRNNDIHYNKSYQSLTANGVDIQISSYTLDGFDLNSYKSNEFPNKGLGIILDEDNDRQVSNYSTPLYDTSLKYGFIKNYNTTTIAGLPAYRWNFNDSIYYPNPGGMKGSGQDNFLSNEIIGFQKDNTYYIIWIRLNSTKSVGQEDLNSEKKVIDQLLQNLKIK